MFCDEILAPSSALRLRSTLIVLLPDLLSGFYLPGDFFLDLLFPACIVSQQQQRLSLLNHLLCDRVIFPRVRTHPGGGDETAALK